MTGKKIIIPRQLKELEGAKFIMLQSKSKDPQKGISWKADENQKDADWIENFCNNTGQNYGAIYPKESRLCVIDEDDGEKFADFNEKVVSYSVRSGRSGQIGRHVYLKISDIEHELLGQKRILLKDGVDIGDVRFPGFVGYNVGPGCLHPSGNYYTPENEDAEITEISVNDLLEALSKAGIILTEDKEKNDSKPQTKTNAVEYGSLLYDAGFSVLDFLYPDNAHTVGDEIEGAHPIHGSENGHNLVITADGSQWYCRRCGSGGGVWEAAAVRYGIIDCSEAGQGLTDDQIKQIKQHLKKDLPRKWEKYIDLTKERKHKEQLALIAKADEELKNEAFPYSWLLVPEVKKTRGGENEITYSINYQKFTEEGVKRFNPLLFNRTLYVAGDNGIYNEDKGLVSAWVGSIIEKWREVEKIPPTKKIDGDVEEIYRSIRRRNVDNDEKSPFNQYQGIPVKNGVICFDKDTKEVTLEKITPEMKFTRTLHVEYDPDADTSKMEEILKSWVSKEDYQILLEIAAVALLQSFKKSSNYKRAYIIQGERDGGKTSYLNLLTLIFGDENIGHIALTDLGGRWTNAYLLGKYLNTADDISSKEITDEGAIKKLSGGKNQPVEEKGKPQYNADLFVTHVFTCNHTPKINPEVDKDNAFWSRWIVLKFPFCFKRNPNWEAENFTDENIKAFMVLVIRKCQDILIHKLPDPDMEDMITKWNAEINPVSHYLNECVRVDKEKFILKDDLYDFFMKYFETLSEEDKRKVSFGEIGVKRNITQAIVRQFGSEYTYSSKVLINGKQRPAYRGLYWKYDNQLMIPYMPKHETNQSQLKP